MVPNYYKILEETVDFEAKKVSVSIKSKDMSKEIKSSEIISWENRHLAAWVRAEICWDIPKIYLRMTESTWDIPEICHRAAICIIICLRYT